MDLKDGSVFAERYRILRPLGSGAVGVVYEALDERTNIVLALKVMRIDAARKPDQRARFEREAEIMRRVESENIVRVIDVGAWGEVTFIAMERLVGTSLAEILERRPVLSNADALSFLGQIGLALTKTHAVSIVHRDLKPENVFIATRHDGTPCVKVLDFGVAKVAAGGSGAAPNTRVLGTPAFMAPEQVRGDGNIGPSADLYAVGHLAYAVLAGEPYWEEDALSGNSVMPLFMKILKGGEETASARAMRRKNVRLPVGFDAWFATATALDPAARFPSSLVEIDALVPILAPAAALGVSVSGAVVLGPAAPGRSLVETGPTMMGELVRPSTLGTATFRDAPRFVDDPTSLASGTYPAVPRKEDMTGAFHVVQRELPLRCQRRPRFSPSNRDGPSTRSSCRARQLSHGRCRRQVR